MRCEIPLLLAASLLASCKTVERIDRDRGLSAASLSQLQRQARQFHSVIAEPRLETTPAEIQQAVSNTLAQVNTALGVLANRDPRQATFANTVRVLDDLSWQLSCTGNRLWLISATSANQALGESAAEAIQRLPQPPLGGEAAYRALKAFAARARRLNKEDARLLSYLVRDYRRAGFDLPKTARAKITEMRRRLAGLIVEFDNHLAAAQDPVKFTQAELEGVPDRVLSEKGVKTGENEYTVRGSQFQTLMENARREATRECMFIAYCNRAATENAPVVQEILELRAGIAHALGYRSWADYAIEPRMAATAATARLFCEHLRDELQPQFKRELEELAALKAKDTGDPNARINWWDTDYYQEQLRRQKFNLDSEQLRVSFRYERVLAGMFSICEHVFGLEIKRVTPAYPWTDQLQLDAISDAHTGAPLGLVYLDMFARDGKKADNEESVLIPGKRLPNGSYQRPVALLWFHLPSLEPGQPLLLTHGEVLSLFHEFGHALHELLTRANYSTFAGTRVPRDFVEAPSQMLEKWAWDSHVLDNLAADYRDPSKKIPPSVLSRLKTARLGTIAIRYRWEVAWALADLALHTEVNEAVDSVKVANQILSDAFLPLPEGTASVTGFEPLPRYAAACYGYLWSEAIAADMATVFEQSPKGLFDAPAGLRLRREIYEMGNSREVNESVEKFLGRPPSLKPFLQELGITSNATVPTH
jgi:thimet oligopeptidase